MNKFSRLLWSLLGIIVVFIFVACDIGAGPSSGGGGEWIPVTSLNQINGSWHGTDELERGEYSKQELFNDAGEKVASIYDVYHLYLSFDASRKTMSVSFSTVYHFNTYPGCNADDIWEAVRNNFQGAHIVQKPAGGYTITIIRVGGAEDMTGADLSGLEIRTDSRYTWLKIPEASITDDFPGPGGFTLQSTTAIHLIDPPTQSPPPPKAPVGSPAPASPGSLPIQVTLSLEDQQSNPIPPINNAGNPIGITYNQFITVELEISNPDPSTRIYPRILAYDKANGRWNTDNYLDNGQLFTFDEYPQPVTAGGHTYRFAITKHIRGFVGTLDLTLGIIFQESDSDLHRVVINSDSSGINPVDLPEIDPDVLQCIFMINFNLPRDI
jgi:hypothetical protein